MNIWNKDLLAEMRDRVRMAIRSVNSTPNGVVWVYTTGVKVVLKKSIFQDIPHWEQVRGKDADY